MDSKKLKKLREKYLDSGSQVFDPKFKKVGDYQFNPEGVRFLPFGGIPTLLDAPQSNKLDDLDVALIGVPMDLGTTNRSGARFGPRAVRGIERVGPYNHNLDVLPFKNKKCADIGDVPFRSRFKLDSCIEDIEKFYHKVVDAGVRGEPRLLIPMPGYGNLIASSASGPRPRARAYVRQKNIGRNQNHCEVRNLKDSLDIRESWAGRPPRQALIRSEKKHLLISWLTDSECT